MKRGLGVFAIVLLGLFVVSFASALEISFGEDTEGQGTYSGESVYVELETSNSGDHYSFVDFDNDLVLWARMEGVSGDEVIDESTYLNYGDMEGDVSQSSGIYGNSLEFDGDADFVDFGNPYALQITDAITVAAWFKTSSNETEFIVSKYDGVENSYRLAIDGVSGAVVFSANLSGSSKYVDSDSAYNDSEWHFAVGTFNGSEMRIYVDGSEDSVPTSYVGSIEDTGADFYIGARSDGDKSFEGFIDDVLVFSRALAPSEIVALNDSSLNPYFHNFTGLVDEEHNYVGYAVNSSGDVESIPSGEGSIEVWGSLSQSVLQILNPSSNYDILVDILGDLNVRGSLEVGEDGGIYGESNLVVHSNLNGEDPEGMTLISFPDAEVNSGAIDLVVSSIYAGGVPVLSFDNAYIGGDALFDKIVFSGSQGFMEVLQMGTNSEFSIINPDSSQGVDLIIGQEGDDSNLVVNGDLEVNGNVNVTGCIHYNGGTLGTCL